MFRMPRVSVQFRRLHSPDGRFCFPTVTRATVEKSQSLRLHYRYQSKIWLYVQERLYRDNDYLVTYRTGRKIFDAETAITRTHVEQRDVGKTRREDISVKTLNISTSFTFH